MPDKDDRSNRECSARSGTFLSIVVEINAAVDAENIPSVGWQDMMNRKKVRWTKPELDTLRHLAGAVPVREIAHWLDRSEQAVRFKAWQEHVTLAAERAAAHSDCAL